jgi:ABC-type branched-subunit amino acid transport system substrate-binding protein
MNLLSLSLWRSDDCFGCPAAEGQKGPIKPGLLLPVTGPQAANGRDMVNGFQLFLDEQGGKLAGRKVRVLIEDDESKPATGLTKLRGLMEGQGIHVLIGPLSTAVGYALRDYIESKKFPAIYPIGRSSGLQAGCRIRSSIPSKMCRSSGPTSLRSI